MIPGDSHSDPICLVVYRIMKVKLVSILLCSISVCVVLAISVYTLMLACIIIPSRLIPISRSSYFLLVSNLGAFSYDFRIKLSTSLHHVSLLMSTGLWQGGMQGVAISVFKAVCTNFRSTVLMT